MAKLDVLDILRAKRQTPLEFDFDNMWIPPMSYYLTPDDVESLRRIATSLKLSSKIEVKYKMIDDIMRNRGFKRFSAGTNRVVYSFYEDPRFVVKIAVDKVGMQDNPMEYNNQFLIKPYCTKMFYISPCGTVGFAERVLPIKNKEEFRAIAGDVFEILVHKILGKYVMEDIGSKYFMNFGLRLNGGSGDGPVILDYPYLYKLDGRKLYCTKVNPATGLPCNGEIDYDAGFNHLVCERCGKIYLATDLKDDSVDNKIIIKGGNEMKIVLKVGDKVINQTIATNDVIKSPAKTKTATKLSVKAIGGSLISQEEAIERAKEIEEAAKPAINLGVVTNAQVDKKDDIIPEEKDNNAEDAESDSKLISGSDEESGDVEIDPGEEPKIETTVEESNDDETPVEENSTIEKALDVIPEHAVTTVEPKVTITNKSAEKKDDTFDPDAYVVADIDRYAQYDVDEDAPRRQPIKKKSSAPERGPDGKFISTKGSTKKKTTSSGKKQTFIPSK